MQFKERRKPENDAARDVVGRIKEHYQAVIDENAKLKGENRALKQQIEAPEPRADVYLWPEFGGEA